MPLIEWNDRLSVRIDTFDNQHKTLVGMVNELNDAMAAGKGKDAAKAILDRLVAYTVEHFNAEEAQMEKHGYPGFAAHKAEHEKLKVQVVDYVGRMNKGEFALAVTLLGFLKGWLMEHILKTDMGYSDFLRSKGVA